MSASWQAVSPRPKGEFPATGQYVLATLSGRLPCSNFATLRRVGGDGLGGGECLEIGVDWTQLLRSEANMAERRVAGVTRPTEDDPKRN
jgi:hypothetical protein